jgi:transcriptional regulator with XRE-family HTH domain
MKTREREEARLLRRQRGLSIKQIAAALDVSQSSVSVWVRDIALTEEQHEALRQQNPAYNGQRVGQAVRAARCRGRRREAQEEGRAFARRPNPLHAAGCMLYWAEGARNRNALRFSNSDPQMARFFMRFLRECFGVPDERVRVWCNLFADHAERQREIEDFWLAMLELPRSCLQKTTVNVYSKYSSKKRKNRLPYGTCRISVHDTRTVQSIFGSIQEYGGFDRPEWLD